MGQTDLHMHSSVSIDGDISPRGLAELCCQEGVTLAALTDHNDIAGVAEFIWRSAQLGVRAIPGIELDCMYETYNLHILGYGIDIADPLLLRAIREARGLLAEAGLRLMDAVEALGIRFDREHVLAQAKHGVICAEMIAEAALKLPENHMHPLIRPLLPGGTLVGQLLLVGMRTGQTGLCAGRVYDGGTGNRFDSYCRRNCSAGASGRQHKGT